MNDLNEFILQEFQDERISDSDSIDDGHRRYNITNNQIDSFDYIDENLDQLTINKIKM